MYTTNLDSVRCRVPMHKEHGVYSGREKKRSQFSDKMTRTIRLRFRSRSLVLPQHLSLSGAQSALINNADLRARTREKSTAVATRRASPRTPAIAHTYLYTVIFKMKEKRAGGRIVVVVVRALTNAIER